MDITFCEERKIVICLKGKRVGTPMRRNPTLWIQVAQGETFPQAGNTPQSTKGLPWPADNGLTFASFSEIALKHHTFYHCRRIMR